MSDSDEGRDVRAAFGTLLADEPASPWSASDDVTRGRALQRRRRTRAGAGIGLVAAVVMVFGVFGPWRPKPVVVVPPAYQPPAVQGVDADWLAALDRSFTAFNGPVVDWSRSTVTPTAGGGFLLDLTLVGATVVTGGEDFTIEYAEPPGPPVARTFVSWKPAGGEGPVLASCAAPECVRSESSVSPGFTNEGARWDADGAQVAGTFVVDQTYTDGAMLELASSPVDGSGDGWATLNFGGITYVLDRVGRPGESSPIEGDDAVAQVLESLGWTVDGVTVQRVPVGQPTETTWGASQPGMYDTTNTGRITVRTWDERSWEAAVNPTSVIAGCTSDALCTPVRSSPADCDSSDCWLTSHATTRAAYVDQPEGSFVSYLYNEGLKLAVEVVVEPLVCITCSASPLPPFLTEQETAQVLDAVQEQVEATPSPTPSETPTSADAVTRVLEGFGFRVTSSVTRAGVYGGTSRTYSVDVDLTADNPVSAILTLTSYPASGVPIGATRVDIDRTVLSACTDTTCTPVTPVTYPCPTSSCIQDWWATTSAAYSGLSQGTLAVFRSNGADGVEAVVGLKDCPTCGQSTFGPPFLTLEQTQQVLNAFGFPVDAAPGEPCTNDQVKLVPAVGSSSGATGERSVTIEVYARNPSVSCQVDGDPVAKLLVGSVPASGLTYGVGLFTGIPQRGTAVLVDSEHAAVFVVSKYRCDAGAIGVADGIDVRLPGSSRSTVVELPTGLALELCGGAATDAGNTVWVSQFTPREGGVS